MQSRFTVSVSKKLLYVCISSFLAMMILGGCAPVLEPALPTDIFMTETAVPPSQQSVSQTPLPTATATMTPLPTLTPQPTATPLPAPTSTPEPTPPPVAVSFAGVQLMWDGRIAEQIFPSEAIWGEMVYTVFKFASEGLCWDVGCIEVYDVAAYEAAHPELPLPPLGAGIVLSTHSQGLRFANGSGSRRVLMRGQDGYFANNQTLLYEFTGFTEDGRFYIVATIPLDAPILLSTYDPEQNSNPHAVPVPTELPQDYRELSELIFAYNREVEQQLALLPATEFSPDLNLLDALIASLVVDP